MIHRPYLKIAVVRDPHYSGDPRPWKVYQPHPTYTGVYMGGWATQQEAAREADRLARRSLEVLMAPRVGGESP